MAKNNIELTLTIKSFIFERYIKILKLEFLIWTWETQNFVIKNNKVELIHPIRMFNNRYIKDRVRIDYEYTN